MTRYLLKLLLSLSLITAASPSLALDPPSVRGCLKFGPNTYELKHAQAVRNPDNPDRLWIVLTTSEVTAKQAADVGKMMGLSMNGKLRGVRLDVDASHPKADELQLALLLSREESPTGEIVFGGGGQKYWETLKLGDKRILGKLRFAKEASSFAETPDWSIDVDFSAPTFGPSR